MNELHRHRSLAHSRRDSLDRSVAHIANRENVRLRSAVVRVHFDSPTVVRLNAGSGKVQAIDSALAATGGDPVGNEPNNA